MKSGVRNFVYSAVACLCAVSGGMLEAQVVVTITSGTPPNAAVGTPYPTFTFTAEPGNCSGTALYAWTATGLPAWATLTENDDDQTANLTGTPTTAGPITFTVTATQTNCSESHASQQYTINVSSPAETTYVLNDDDNALSVLSLSGSNVSTVVSCSNDSLPCENYGSATDFAIDQSGNFIVAAESGDGPGTAIVMLNPSNASNPATTVGSPAQLEAAGETYDTDYADNANFFSVAVDAGGNYIVADSGNHAIWFFPPGGSAQATLVGTYFSENSGEDVFVRIAGGNYIVAEDGGEAEIQLYQFTGCTSGGCPAVQDNPTVLLGEGAIEGFLGGLTIDPTSGNYIIDDAGVDDSDFVYPYVVEVIPGSVPYNYQALYGSPDSPSLLDEPLGLFADPQTGNFLIVDNDDSDTVYALSSDGTGIALASQNGVFTNPISVLVVPQVTVQQPSGPSGPPPLVLTGVALPGAFADEPYSASIGASGGSAPYTYSGSGAPAGITIASYGAISGTTTATGNFNLSITVTDGLGHQASATFTLLVSPPPPVSVLGGTLTTNTLQTPISQTLGATGGAPPYTWTFLGGAVPPGMTLQTSGTLNGIPSKAGTYSFTARATDTTGGTAVGTFSITILSPPLTVLSPSPLASGMVTVDYPPQTISATGGVPPYTFAVTQGSLPPGISLDPDGAITGTPTATGTTFTVTATDSETPPSVGAVHFSLAVRPLSPDLILSAGSVSFAIAAGTAALPTSQTVQVQATEVAIPIGYSVAISPASASWLSVSSAGGETPGSFAISLAGAASSLAASATPYQASVVVTCTVAPCNGNAQTVAVSLTVSIVPPQLSVINNSLAFNTLAATPLSTTQTLSVQNSGGGTIGIASITCGAPWCQVTGVPATIGAGVTAPIGVTANPAGLNSGYYWTDISVVSSAGRAIVPVTFQIAANGTMTLAPAGAEFTLPQGGNAVGETSFLVSVSGSASVSFNATVSAGAPWLSVTPASGTASGTQPASVNLVFNQTLVSALTPGAYYATVQIVSTGAANSPQSFEVVLNVTAATQESIPDPVPGGLIYLTQATSTPPAQTVTAFSSSPTATSYQASASTNSGGKWLSVSPTTGSTSAAAEAQSSISANPLGLSPGVYTGTVSYAFAATAVRSVNVTLVVEASGSASTTASQISQSSPRPAAAGGCTPTQIVPTSTALVSNFAAPAAWPVELAVSLVDDCGSAIGNGQVVATFSNGDPPLVLNPADPTTGLYDGTWTPQHTSGQVVINAAANAPGLPATTLQISGGVTPNIAPILATQSIANFFNPVGGAPLAPGTLVQITGQYLAGQTLTDSTIPLPVTLGGTSVIIGGIQAPISSVSPGQINAQVPFELPPGQPYQVIVSANGALTTPDSFEAGGASPGLSVLPNGYVQASHQSGAPVTETAPAAPGENVAVYLVGMGATTIPVSSGQPGPSSPFASTVTTPVITLNNETVTSSFSGLIPGLVGVYQVNMQVPQDAANGDLTLTLSESGLSSNSGILPVHK